MHKKLLLFLLQTIAVQAILVAQESSVYSRYGLGLMANHNSNASNMQGGLGSTYRSIEGPSYINPASISAIKLVSFDVGISGVFSNLKTSSLKERQSGFNLDYLSVSVPIKKFWSSTVALLPYARKDFQVRNSTTIDSTSSYITETNGNGNLNEILWSNGFKVKGFSMGIGLGYTFGKQDNISATTTKTDDVVDLTSYSSYEKNTYKAKAFNLDLGVQYELKIKNKKDTLAPYFMTFGFSVNAPFFLKNQSYETQLKSFYNEILLNRSYDESLADFINDKVENESFLQQYYVSKNWENFVPDTFAILSNNNLKMKVPPAFNVGVAFTKDYKFNVGVDFRYQPWSKYKGYETNAASDLQDSWRIAAGGEVIPNIKKFNKFFSKLKYRAGFYYAQTPVNIRNNSINEFGINFGVGIPMFNRYASEEGFMQSYITYPFNIGFEIGKRGTINDNLVSENFVKFKIGFSLNDKWFVKRKYY